MSRAFTHYWNKSSWEGSAHDNGQPLHHVASNVFAQRGVEPGDRVYVVTVQKGELFLLGRMEVGQIVNYAHAEASLDYTPWAASDHLLARSCTAMRFDRPVSGDMSSRLRFEGPKGPTALKFKAAGVLDEQTLRGVRRLTDDSAALLDTLLAREPLHVPKWPEVELPSDDDENDDEYLLEPLIEHFDARGYPYDINEDGDLVSELQRRDETHFIFATAVGPFLTTVVSLPVEVPERRRPVVAEAIIRANSENCLQTFGMDYGDGAVSCTFPIFNDCGLLDSQTAGSGLENVVHRASCYVAAFRAVVRGEQSPAEAVAAAEARYHES